MAYTASLLLICVGLQLLPADAGRMNSWLGQGDDAELKKPLPNTDRMTCIRQDDLDLVKPLTKEHMIRMVIPVDKDDPTKDVMFSVEKLWIKEVNLNVKMHRKPNSDTFTFDVSGTTASEVDDQFYDDLASVDFWLSGVDILLRNKAMDMAASFATDRDNLKDGQSGTLRFKMYGEGRAEFNDDIGQWEIKLLQESSDTKPFDLKIEKQWLLENSLSKFGGIDKVIMDNLWPAVAKIFPVSMATTFKYMMSDELMLGMEAKVTGRQATADEPLKLMVWRQRPIFKLNALPWRLLQEFSQNFDPVKVAEQQMEALIRKQDIEGMWRMNKNTVIAMLRRYGMNTDWLEDGLDIEKLKERLVQAAKDGADFALKAMKPFIEASKLGQREIFSGVALKLETVVEWNKDVDDGRIAVHVKAPEGPEADTKFIEVPQHFIEAVGGGVGPAKFLVTPTTDRTLFTHAGLTLNGRDVVCKTAQMENLRIRTGGSNGSSTKVWKMGGVVEDITVFLPETANIGWSFAWDKANIELQGDGTIVLDGGLGGMELRQLPPTGPKPPPISAGKIRQKEWILLDGVVPEDVARPTQAKKELSLPDMVPAMNLDAKIKLAGDGANVKMDLFAGGEISLNLKEILRGVLTARPSEDFGYTFYAGMLTREVDEPEAATLPYVGKEMGVVVSCGFLRLIDYSRVFNKGNMKPFDVIDFDPKDTGQIEIDLTQYKFGGPDLINAGSAKPCISLYTNGVPQRKHRASMFASKVKVTEKLCGPKEKVDKLMRAINVQIDRWENLKAQTALWRYGTHLAEEYEQPVKQYVLPEGKVTEPLTNIIRWLQGP